MSAVQLVFYILTYLSRSHQSDCSIRVPYIPVREGYILLLVKHNHVAMQHTNQIYKALDGNFGIPFIQTFKKLVG